MTFLEALSLGVLLTGLYILREGLKDDRRWP